MEIRAPFFVYSVFLNLEFEAKPEVSGYAVKTRFARRGAETQRRPP